MRGNSIKYVTIPDEVLDMVQEEDLSKESEYSYLFISAGTYLPWCCSSTYYSAFLVNYFLLV